MNTYQYNIAGEIRYVRADDKFHAWLKVFHGELNRIGKCSLKRGDLKLVDNPNSSKLDGSKSGGNKVFNGLNHL